MPPPRFPQPKQVNTVCDALGYINTGVGLPVVLCLLCMSMHYAQQLLIHVHAQNARVDMGLILELNKLGLRQC